MNTKEVALLTGISVRTLHHYDEIGLLSPTRNGENRYRDYKDEDLDKLQQILFFKECGFPLGNIKKLIESQEFDREKAFLLQEKYLLYEKKRIETMLNTLHKSMKSMKGMITMSQKEKFKGFDMNHNPYEEEAKRLWGDETVKKSNDYMKRLSKDEKDEVAKQMDDLFTELANLRQEDPTSEEAQKAMDKMYHYFNNNFGYNYSLEAFKGLGMLYVADERFTENIDKYGEGLSDFLSKAMSIYAQSRKE